MSLKKSRWTVVVVAIWVIALTVVTVTTPATTEAAVSKDDIHRVMTYAPNHPDACVPLEYDCFVVYVYPPS